ncbi:MAG: ABC transporter ATP-binding protein [Anaerolineae bacterium]|nr:ABC transporter ATP-binding protein [Anaerolineae bacterium]
MIEITDLTKTYNRSVHALNGVTLTIGTGMFGLLGPNGAGKTTLMRILAGLLRPTSGSATIFGNDVATLRGRMGVKALLGYLPQELGLYPNLNALEFLDYMAILKGVNDARQRRAQIDRLIQQVHLDDVAQRPLKTYSGGMKRRIGIAQALLGDPRLLIVDEPTSGLDPEERIRFRNLLVDMAQDRAIILSTHIVEDISQSCNDLAVMRGGRVIYRGAPADLIEQAKGHVWIVKGQRPDEQLILVSSLQMHDGVHYRAVGDASRYPGAVAAEPSLEDGYMWLMQDKRAGEREAARQQ